MFLNVNEVLSEEVTLDSINECLSEAQNLYHSMNESIVSRSLLSENQTLLLEGTGSKLQAIIDRIKEFFRKIGLFFKNLFSKKKDAEMKRKEADEKIKENQKKEKEAEKEAKAASDREKARKYEEKKKRTEVAKEAFMNETAELYDVKKTTAYMTKVEGICNNVIKACWKSFENTDDIKVFSNAVGNYADKARELGKGNEGVADAVKLTTMTYRDAFNMEEENDKATEESGRIAEYIQKDYDKLVSSIDRLGKKYEKDGDYAALTASLLMITNTVVGVGLSDLVAVVKKFTYNMAKIIIIKSEYAASSILWAF